MRILGDKPLFCHAIQNALLSSYVDDVVIDSDSDEILRIGEKEGAIPLKRPLHLAINEATGDDLAYWQASNYPKSDIIVQTPPTSPFLNPASIDHAIFRLSFDNFDSVAGVYKDVFYRWINDKPTYYTPYGNLPNSFNMIPTVYETMGLCAVRTEFVLKHKKRLNIESCSPLYLSKIESVDINTEDDFHFAQIIWQGLYGGIVDPPMINSPSVDPQDCK